MNVELWALMIALCFNAAISNHNPQQQPTSTTWLNSPDTSAVTFEALGHQLQFAQDPNSKHLGTTVWDASMVFAKFLEREIFPIQTERKACDQTWSRLWGSWIWICLKKTSVLRMWRLMRFVRNGRIVFLIT